MCTDEEAKNLERTFYKYYYGRIIDYADISTVRKLVMAGILEWTSDGEHSCAGASYLGRHIPYVDPDEI